MYSKIKQKGMAKHVTVSFTRMVGKHKWIAIQELRNITTGKLHTTMSDVYTVFNFFIGQTPFTHQLPALWKRLTPLLKKQITDPRFWDEKYDPTHIGRVKVRTLTRLEQQELSFSINENIREILCQTSVQL